MHTLLLTDWEQAHNEEGPSLEDEDLSELLRQSMSLELEELMATPAPVTRQRRAFQISSVESVARVVEKKVQAFNTEIELVEAQTGAASEAVSVAHSEDVSAWAGAISQWLREHSSTGSVSLMDLQKGVGMPLVEVWLGLLLRGNFVVLEQQGDFYSPYIWVTQKWPEFLE